MSRYVVLLSSGLDSTTNLALAAREGEVPLALTFDYGQRAADREIDRASEICKRLQIPHKIISLPWFRDFTETSLLNTSMIVPLETMVSIDNYEQSLETAKSVWVPNRNGIFLNIAAGFAEGLKADFVVPGFNLEEAQTFPDNSQGYMQALDHSFSFSTQGRVKVQCFTANLNKTEIVRLAKKIEAPLDLVWPCYLGEEKPCGQCESCQRFARAVSEA